MNTLTFDTHNFVKRLTAAGMPEPQAEVLAEEQTNLIENNLATKRDLMALEVTLKRDLKELEVALKRDIRELETSQKSDMREMELRIIHTLTIRLGGMLVTGIVVVAVLVKLL